MNQMQPGDDKAGIRHYPERRILLAEEGPPAGGNPGEQGRHLAGVGDLGWLCAVWRSSLGCDKNRRRVAGRGGEREGIKESRLADLFHNITSSPQYPQGNDNTSPFYTKFREHWTKYE